MYTRILVPLDGSRLAEQVLPYARTLAKGFNARVEVLRVVEPLPPIGLMDPFREVRRRELVTSLAKEAEEYLEKLSESFKLDGKLVPNFVRMGNPESEIIQEAESVPGTLIAMSTHGRSGPGRWALGSIADKVLRGTANPVLIIRPRRLPAPDRPWKLENAIIPLDGTDLAEAALPHLAGLAGTLGLRVVLVRVTPSTGEYHRYAKQIPSGEKAPAYLREFVEISENVDSEALAYLHEVKNRLRDQGLRQIDEHLLHGAPAAAIVDLARQTPHDLIVMTTHARSGVQRWVLGSVADRVVRHSGTPVLFIRPESEPSPED